MKHHDTRQETIGRQISRKALIGLGDMASPKDERCSKSKHLTSSAIDTWAEITFQVEVAGYNIRKRGLK